MAMKMSDAGLSVMCHHEGYRNKAYDDGAGYMTIGYGHLILPTEKALLKGTITKEQALDLLRNDVGIAEAAVTKQVKVPLTQSQFDALVSFTFNAGGANLASSTLLKLLNAGHYDTVPAQLQRWTRAGGKVMKGLVNRRVSEAAMWNGQYPDA